MTLTRRSALVVLGGGAALVCGGLATVASISDEDLVHAVLQRHLGPINIAQEDLAAFLAEVRERQPWLFPPEKLAVLYGAAERLDLADVARRNLPGDRGLQIERFERHLLGDFHMATDIAFRSSEKDPVHFLGQGACLNPFAKFA